MRLLVFLLSVGFCQSAVACSLDELADAKIVKSNRYQLSYRFLPAKPAVGKHFNLEIEVRDQMRHFFGGSISVSATMPAHKHGMNYLPTVKVSSPGRFLAEGYMFHMPGAWRFIFDLRTENKSQRIVSDYQLE